MKLQGFTHFKVNGLNIEKLINNLNKENIHLYNVDRKIYRQVLFSVDFMHSKKVIAYLKRMCYNYTITSDSGVYPSALFLFKRLGLLLGVFIFAAVFTISNFFVCEIKVYGCENLDKQSILQSINDIGIKKMSFNRGSPKEIEKTIYSDFNNVAFVSAKYYGLILKIKIVESKPTPIVLDTAVRDLVSGCDGKITKIIVFQGTPMVKAGDTVKKGQVLIGGFWLKPDGEEIRIRAIGTVYGSAEILYTQIFQSAKTVLQRSGSCIVTKYIDTFGIKFPVSTYNNTYASFETETEYSYIFRNNFLPSKLVTVTYYQTETAIIRENFDKVKKVIIEEAEIKAAAEAEKEGKITEIMTTIRDKGEIKYIDTLVYIEKSFLKSGE